MWTLVLLLSLAGQQGDPSQLVEQLGSPRFNEREAATEALKRMGAQALTALREATRNEDIERRTRATNLLSEIEARIMVEPTLVKLGYRNRSILEVVSDLGEQASVNIALFPENAQVWNEKRITLETAEPVPFWEAIDRLCRESGLMVSNANQMMQVAGNAPQARKRGASLQLLMNNGLPGPSSVAGPVRSIATNVLHHRDRVFNQNGAPGVVVQPGAGNLKVDGEQAKVAQAGVMTETFGVGIQIIPEPRLTMVQNGNMKIVEAMDDTGRSLAPPSDPSAVNRFQGFNGMAGGSMLQLQVMLSPPSPTAKTIKQLKLVVPVVLMSRRNEPFVIQLANAKGKTFESSEMTLQVHDIKDEPNQQFTTIELTVKMKKPEPSGNPNQGPFGQEFTAFRFTPGQSQSQVEIVDAQGRLFTQWFPFNPQPGNDGLRMGLRLMPNEGIGPPAEIRLYDLGRAESEAVVELHDVPLP